MTQNFITRDTFQHHLTKSTERAHFNTSVSKSRSLQTSIHHHPTTDIYFEDDADTQMVRTQVPGRDTGIYALEDHLNAAKSDKVELKGRN